MSTFPIAGPFETRVAGTTIIKKSYADAVDAAFNGLYGATKSIVGLTLDGTGDVASTPLPAAVAFNINSGDTWQAIAYAFDATPTSAKPYFYVKTSDGSLAIANNATWIEITGKWTCIATGSNATRILQTNGVWKFQYHVATATPWVEASWVDVLGLDGATDIATFVQDIVSTNGKLTLNAHRSSATPGSGQSLAAGVTYADTSVFAWGIVSVNPAGPSISLVRGVNVNAVSRNAAGQYDVILQTAATNNLCVIVTPLIAKAASAFSMTVDSADGTGPTTTTFRVLAFSASNTLSDVPGTGNNGFYFVCYQG